MSELPGLFDDDEPPPERQPDADNRRITAPEPAPNLKPAEPCRRPFDGKVLGPHASHQCRVGKGDAAFTDDGGRTWFCREHAPPGFFPTMADWPEWRP